jgi:hypothetical protein
MKIYQPGGIAMEAVYYAARANLRRLMRLHPQWTQQQYAQAEGTLPVGRRSSHSGVSIMSTSVWVAKERQPRLPIWFRAEASQKAKNTAQKRHSCTLFDALSIFVECSATRRRSTRSRLGFRALLLCAVPQQQLVRPPKTPASPFDAAGNKAIQPLQT